MIRYEWSCRASSFTSLFFSLSLIGLDLILGMQWLEMLGFMVCNGKQLTMDFIWDNQN
jgi:hypothetical protein